MKIIYNKWIPFKGFLAMNLFGILFVRKKENGSNPILSKRTINHEMIHTAQIKELGYVFFYIAYLLSWLVRIIMYPMAAYRYIVFEQEAYDNDSNLDYLKSRKAYSWIKYIGKCGKS